MTITIDEIKTKIAKIEQEQQLLKDMITKYEEQEAGFLKGGDQYYYIGAFGSICNVRYDNDNDDAKLLSLGNAFRTREEAEFAVEQLKVIAELKKCGGVWGTPQKSNTAIWLDGFGRIKISDYCHQERPTIYFSSKKQAQNAIDTIGAERLLKYWFCVEA